MPLPVAVMWSVAALLFGVFLAACLWPARLTAGHRLVLLLLQAACGLCMVWTRPQGAASATLVIVAAQLPYVVRPTATWLWVLTQTVCIVLAAAPTARLLDRFSIAAAYGGFQLFAVATSMLALSERRSREALSLANAELTATRELLTGSTRASERLRISRDLHDTLGHHLTALSLQLDVASRLTSGAAADHLQEAHAIARLLLSDVRHVVSEIRDTGRIDLAAALRGYETQPSPVRVHVDIPDALTLEQSDQAQTVIRCVQEIVTNAVRHSSAGNLWIAVRRSPGGLTLEARDDGRGVATIAPGNGLKGMRERFEQHAGHIEFASARGCGFEVHGFMPLSESAP
jgi:signal transduction histidine kinase